MEEIVDNGKKKLHTQRIGRSSSVEEMIIKMRSQPIRPACPNHARTLNVFQQGFLLMLLSPLCRNCVSGVCAIS